MELSLDQVAALAPDAGSLAAGKKLGSPGSWRSLGRNPAALWGECSGSAVYQVRVDLGDLAVKCTCPSRKFPCKHGLGLLFLAAVSDAAVPTGEPPEWVGEWLAKRTESAQRKAARPAVPAAGEEVPARARRTDRRAALVRGGLEALDLWLADLIRHGLAQVDREGAAIWERHAARLVDAQAPGLAARVRRLAGIPHSRPDWPARLLARLGRIALLTEAFGRIDALDPSLQEDVRQAIGWTLTREEVIARGETIRDRWLVIGQQTDSEDRLRVQSTWLAGCESRRTALVLQFAQGTAAFPEVLVPGLAQEMALSFWPSAWPQRALVRDRLGASTPWPDVVPGVTSLTALLDEVATALGRQPWLDRFGCLLLDVIPVPGSDGAWWVRDAEGRALPLAGVDHWRLLALSGGRPIALGAEWDGEALTPLLAYQAGVPSPLGGGG